MKVRSSADRLGEGVQMCRRWSLIGLVCVFSGCLVAVENDAVAQVEQFSAETTNELGSHFTLVIKQSGSRLSFDIKAESAQTSLSGIPSCASTDLKPDGTFLTHCAGFGSGFGGSSFRCQLAGNLSTARIENVPRFGTAEFRFVRGPMPAKR